MEKKTCNTVLTPETVLVMAHGPVAGQNWRPFVPMAVYVPVRDPSTACDRVTDMFVIPAAGPGDTHVPVMFVLEGVVSDGPQARLSAQTAVMNFIGIESGSAS